MKLAVVNKLVLIAAVGLWSYHNSLHVPLVYDDHEFLLSNPLIRSLGSADWWSPTTYRPVLLYSFALCHAAGGLHVEVYHAANLAIHLGSALVLFGLVRRSLLLPPQGTRFAHSATWLATAVAALWVVHPLNTESVTYIWQRAESLMGFFYLGTLYSLLRGATSRRPWPWYVLAVASSWLALGVKEVAVTAPAAALLYDRLYLAATWREVWRRRWPLYAAMVLPWLVFGPAFVARMCAPSTSTGFGYRHISPLEHLCTQAGVIVHYGRLCIWPSPLCLDYAWPIATTARQIVLPGLAVLAVVGASLWGLCRGRRLAYVAFSALLILSPTSSIVPIADQAVEHRMYLPLAAVTILVVMAGYWAVEWALIAVGGSRRARAWFELCVVAALVLMLGSATLRRNALYADPVALWADVVAQVPDNPRGHNNLGVALENAGREAEAIAAYRAAIRLQPARVDAYCNLGLCLWRSGRREEATEVFRAAVKLDPRHAESRNNLGGALLERGEIEAATAQFQRALELKPDFDEARYNLELARAKSATTSGGAQTSQGSDAAPRPLPTP